ncbi:MAG TPA: winged helix-turn-helix domain-containing protein [Gemmatimonadaceae bacterium]|nr:winged helix-turn-helix domain-containing protein [Gemmatimonadaceae bacterium]
MLTDDSIAQVALLLADATRVAILGALADGLPRPAGELARRAGVRASTASEHLARLLDGGLVVAERRGRHRFYRVRGAEVVSLLETIGTFARPTARPPARAARDAGLRHARACYDHLAGALGVAVTEALVARGALVLHDERYEVPTGSEGLLVDGLGVDLAAARASRRQFARACLDWTERRWHLAGALGAELLRSLRERGWLEAVEGRRALRVTPLGRRALRATLGLDAASARWVDS